LLGAKGLGILGFRFTAICYTAPAGRLVPPLSGLDRNNNTKKDLIGIENL